MRNFLGITLLIIIAGCSGVRQNQPDKPNIVFILADDLGYGDLACYGSDLIGTPNIDKLAESGMMFTDHYSGSPVCAPSRCVLLTGKHSGHAYIRGNDEWGDRGEVWDYRAMIADSTLEGQRPLPGDAITIGKILQSRGYATGMIGKWGLGAPQTDSIPTRQGFDFFCGYNCQRQAHTCYPVNIYLDEDIREEYNVAAEHPDLIRQIESIMSREHVPSELERFHLKALGD